MGPYPVLEAELGIPLPAEIPVELFDVEVFDGCPGDPPFMYTPPNPIPAMMYYPNPEQTNGTAALVIFGHALRPLYCNDNPNADPTLLDNTQDFKRYTDMLTHLASHGCVVVIPDLSWLTKQSGVSGLEMRADVLVAVWKHFVNNGGALPLNGNLIPEKVDPSRVMLAGHSTGAAACFRARARLVSAGGPDAVAIGALTPAAAQSALDIVDAPPSYGLLVMKGTQDTQQGANPDDVFNMGGQNRRVLVTLDGGNHFGFTHLCAPNGCFFVADNPCLFGPDRQKDIGGAYLAAMMRRFAYNDLAMNQSLTQSPQNEPDVIVVASPTSW